MNSIVTQKKNPLVFNFSFIILIVLFIVGCTDPKTKPKTIENLKAAYTHETIASAQFAAFAQKTRDEGMDRLSVLFLSVSKAKEIYATNFKTALVKLGAKVDTVKPEFVVKSTLENLEEALKSETNDFNVMYPKFTREAFDENSKKAFKWVQETEKKHVVYYNDAINAILQNWTNAFYTLYFICPTCGNIYYPQQAEDKCSNCSTLKEKFISEG